MAHEAQLISISLGLVASITRRALPLFAVAVMLLGCHRIPEGRDAVDRVALDGVPRGTGPDLEEGLSTKNSPKLLGFIPGVFEYNVYSEDTLNKDLERVERELRRRGYYEAKVRAARVVRTAENKVRVEIDVDAGPRVKVNRVETLGLAKLPFDAAQNAVEALELEVDDPFDEGEYEKGKLDIANALADTGYAFARVNGTARVDLTNHTADVRYTADPGPRAVLGDIDIIGLEKVPEGPVRSALLLEKGQRYSRRELELARSALGRLGVFSRVELTPVLDHPESKTVPVVVRVEESALRTVNAGLGARLDVLRLSVYGQVGWTHRNFFGGLRKFTVSTKPGLTFFPARIDALIHKTDAGTENEKTYGVTGVLPENSLSMTLEQPSFIEGRTKGFIETAYNVYPLLYPLPEGVDPNLETVVGYNEVTARTGVERPFLEDRLPISLSLNWRANFPFTYQGEKVCGDPARLEPGECGLDTVIVTYPELTTLYDLRDDPIAPTVGAVLSNSFQVGVPILGGLVSDVRIKPEVRGYLPLNFSRSLVLAARFTAGFLFPIDESYGNALLESGPNVDYSNPETIRDQHKLLFRAFYSGGPSSNRGYPYQRIGPQGAIGFLVPTGENCNGATADLPSSCIRPLGGFTLWEASLEVRWKVSGPIGFVAFVDASDVSSKLSTFTFTEPHLSVGPGFRYDSPVGPLRVDLGFRLPGLQKLADNPDEPPDISDVAPYVDETLGVALHILLGEAF